MRPLLSATTRCMPAGCGHRHGVGGSARQASGPDSRPCKPAVRAGRPAPDRRHHHRLFQALRRAGQCRCRCRCLWLVGLLAPGLLDAQPGARLDGTAGRVSRCRVEWRGLGTGRPPGHGGCSGKPTGLRRAVSVSGAGGVPIVPIVQQTWTAGVDVFAVAADRGQTITTELMDWPGAGRRGNGCRSNPARQRLDALHMREQRTLGHRPHARRHVVIGQRHPIVQAAPRPGLHHLHDLGFTTQTMRLQ